ncbi:MAG TPA: hypothetical protein VGH44_05690 [Candidatus Saccharimonadia bacterium]
MTKPAEAKPKTRRQKMAPWLLGLMVLAAGAVATWAAFGNSVIGRADLFVKLPVWTLVFALSLYAITLLFGVIGWYIALLAGIVGVVAVVAGHLAHNDYAFYSGWMLLIIAAVLGGVALLLRAYINYR